MSFQILSQLQQTCQSQHSNSKQELTLQFFIRMEQSQHQLSQHLQDRYLLIQTAEEQLNILLDFELDSVNSIHSFFHPILFSMLHVYSYFYGSELEILGTEESITLFKRKILSLIKEVELQFSQINHDNEREKKQQNGSQTHQSLISQTYQHLIDIKYLQKQINLNELIVNVCLNVVLFQVQKIKSRSKFTQKMNKIKLFLQNQNENLTNQESILVQNKIPLEKFAKHLYTLLKKQIQLIKFNSQQEDISHLWQHFSNSTDLAIKRILEPLGLSSVSAFIHNINKIVLRSIQVDINSRKKKFKFNIQEIICKKNILKPKSFFQNILECLQKKLLSIKFNLNFQSTNNIKETQNNLGVDLSQIPKIGREVLQFKLIIYSILKQNYQHESNFTYVMFNSIFQTYQKRQFQKRNENKFFVQKLERQKKDREQFFNSKSGIEEMEKNFLEKMLQISQKLKGENRNQYQKESESEQYQKEPESEIRNVLQNEVHSFERSEVNNVQAQDNISQNNIQFTQIAIQNNRVLPNPVSQISRRLRRQISNLNSHRLIIKQIKKSLNANEAIQNINLNQQNQQRNHQNQSEEIQNILNQIRQRTLPLIQDTQESFQYYYNYHQQEDQSIMDEYCLTLDEQLNKTIKMKKNVRRKLLFPKEKSLNKGLNQKKKSCCLKFKRKLREEGVQNKKSHPKKFKMLQDSIALHKKNLNKKKVSRKRKTLQITKANRLISNIKKNVPFLTLILN